MLNVIVTGGSRGLGLAMAKRLAAAGYRVIAIARNDTEQRAAASLACGESGEIVFRSADLSEIEKLPTLMKALRGEFGGFYGLINNAAGGVGGVLGNMRDVDIERLVRLNSIAPMVLTKYAARSMMTARSGRIVNIASVTALKGHSGLSVYSATKSSLVGFTRSLARELGPLGITVNAIAPGFIATDMTADLDDAQRDRLMRRSALRRLAEPEDVARSVEFLLGEGGRNITGTVTTIDAGNIA